MTRAIWKGELTFAKQKVAVKLYAAAQDRTVHFHLLHEKDLSPVEQHIIRKDTGKDVPPSKIRKALTIGPGTAVILEPDELESLIPEDSRAIELLRFVPRTALNDQWYDRPYYLGPDRDAGAYFALAQALEKRKAIGIARWVMRKRRYLGALDCIDGYLTLSSLRRADQVLSISHVRPAKASTPSAAELKLARQLIESIEGQFDPADWRNDYRTRLDALIAAKASGEKVKAVRPRKAARRGTLSDNLKASLAAVKEKKVA